MTEVKRILVVKLSALGDLFHAMPVVHLLAEHYGCKVDWVTQPEYAALVECHQNVDRVISFPRKGGMADSKTFLRQLRVRHYDLALDLQGLTKSGLVLGLCRARRKIGSSHPREAAKFFAGETPVAGPDSVHALDGLLDSLVHLGIRPEPLRYPLRFPPLAHLQHPGSPLVALAPRSRWPAKDWPEGHFIELGKRLIAELHAKIWILGGPDDQEIGERCRQEMGAGVENLCGRHPLLALGPLLKQVDCLVSNDSGPMHFAAAVGTPLVALFGPTDPALTGPRGDAIRVLRPEPGPEGYPPHRSYKKGGNAFISRISVSKVFEAVVAQLQMNTGKEDVGKADFLIDETP
ncbi:glycosyltransferase family 9 protein [Kiritimatiellaeota bacterium B1221]|nr:glycosyltransferase family 9 protein [Kiritimatiellaeota bacterium B1221]